MEAFNSQPEAVIKLGFVSVNCMDPQHGRLATSDAGLYPAILLALEQCQAAIASDV